MAHPPDGELVGERTGRSPRATTADPRDLCRLCTFYVAAGGGGDLRAAFVIDGRAYTDPDAVRADIAAAVHELHRRRLAAQFFTTPVTPDSPRLDLPDWQSWMERTLSASAEGE